MYYYIIRAEVSVNDHVCSFVDITSYFPNMPRDYWQLSQDNVHKIVGKQATVFVVDLFSELTDLQALNLAKIFMSGDYMTYSYNDDEVWRKGSPKLGWNG